MTKQHQILAVEPTRQSAADKQLAECTSTFSKKANLFTGNTRELTLFGRTEANKVEFDALEAKDRQNNPVQNTVAENLNYMAGVVGSWIDVTFQKELTNQKASADVVIDGVVVIQNAPATFLLGMETRLNKLRDLYLSIPTLAPGTEWEPAPSIGVNIFKSPKKFDVKTLKTVEHVRLPQTSDKHPDTFTTKDIVTNVGQFTDQQFSGMISVADKASLIARLDKLLMAVKVARQGANDCEVIERHCSKDIFEYLHRSWHDVEQMKKATNG